MKDLQNPSAKVYFIPIVENPRRFSLKNPILLKIKPVRQVTAVRNHISHRFVAQRELPVKPSKFGLMSIEIRKKAVPANMIPVDMGSYSCQWLARQGSHLIENVADSKPCINQKRMVAPL
jgi:hypothetical protein